MAARKKCQRAWLPIPSVLRDKNKCPAFLKMPGFFGGCVTVPKREGEAPAEPRIVPAPESTRDSAGTSPSFLNAVSMEDAITERA